MRKERLGDLTARIAGGVDGDGRGDGPVVVLLHGFGAPGDDLVQLWRAIDAPHGTRWVFPEAPIAFDMGFGDSRAWWMIDMVKLQTAMMTGRARDLVREVPPGMSDARAKLRSLFDALPASLGAENVPIVLGGFSQGSMLSCDLALRESIPLAGLVLLSGTLLAEDEWVPKMPSRRDLPVFQSHGRADPILPYSGAEALRDQLRRAGLTTEFESFDGGHAIPPRVLDRLGVFLHRVAGKGA